MGQESRRGWWTRMSSTHPAAWALGVVALVTWQIAITLFIGMVRNTQADAETPALDGTAFTLLSALVAMWTGFGVWSGRGEERRRFLWISLSALAGVVLVAGVAMLYMAFAEGPFAIPSNVAQLVILVTSALISIVGASVGYSPGGGGFRPDPPPED